VNTKKPNSIVASIPNYLTLFRIGVVPFLLVLYPLDIRGVRLFCALLFALAALTDWLDGYIARTYKAESRLGAMLDPLADKMLTASALLLLAYSRNMWVWMAGVFLCRDVAISGARLIAARQGFSIPVDLIGKFKTLFLDIALTCLLVNEALFGWPFREVGMGCAWIAFFCSITSAWQYFKLFWEKVEL
jgi:CDP-diacylglycerol---glycerol-3-phosphate 3-phosphatidyltransferase